MILPFRTGVYFANTSIVVNYDITCYIIIANSLRLPLGTRLPEAAASGRWTGKGVEVDGWARKGTREWFYRWAASGVVVFLLIGP